MNQQTDVKPKALSLKAAKELVKRELGISTANLKRDEIWANVMRRYVMELGNYEVIVDDSFKRGGRIRLVLEESGRSIVRYFNSRTLEEDIDYETAIQFSEQQEDFEERLCDIGLEGCRRILKRLGAIDE